MISYCFFCGRKATQCGKLHKAESVFGSRTSKTIRICKKCKNERDMNWYKNVRSVRL